MYCMCGVCVVCVCEYEYVLYVWCVCVVCVCEYEYVLYVWCVCLMCV